VPAAVLASHPRRHDLSPYPGRCPTLLRVSLLRIPGWAAAGERSSAPCRACALKEGSLSFKGFARGNTFASPNGCFYP